MVLNELNTRAVRDEAMRETLDASDTAWRQYLLEILRAGRDGGQFRADLAPEAAAMLVIGFFKSLIFHPGVSADSARRRGTASSRSTSARVLQPSR
ncbi:TetR family transcriptional regulator C-terminal domain-containing protein [Streptomyces sp. NPDC002499]